MLKKRACKHCVGQFQPVRTGHLFCSDTCRKLSFKAKNRAKTQATRNKKLAEKLKKLANSAFGLYLIKELRRAKTVEILQGHDSESLDALVSLRRRCTASAGYEDGESMGFYELSHIYPVSGKNRLGLLHTTNLAITPATFNRKHGTKLPVDGYLGSSIPREGLSKQWKIVESLNNLDILKLARKYIGEEFDIWLKKHLINQTQKGAILKKLKEAGYDNDVLKTMGLRELKSIADEEKIPYFSMSKDPEEDWWLARNEMERLKLDNSVSKHLNLYYEAYSSFDDFLTFNDSPDKELEFKTYLVQQAFLCIHGQLFEEKWKGKSFSLNLQKVKINRVARTKYDDDDDDDYL
jgi:hypothetical protein